MGLFCNTAQRAMSEQLTRLAVHSCKRLSLMTQFNPQCCEYVPFTLCNSFLTMWQMGKLTKLIAAYCHSETTRHCAKSTCMSGVAWLMLVHSSKVAFSLLNKWYHAQSNKAGTSRRKSTEMVFTKPKEIRDERLLGHFSPMTCPLKHLAQFACKNVFKKARDWN